MMPSTKHKLPRAPIVLLTMPMRRLRVGHDRASLNTLNCKIKKSFTAAINMKNASTLEYLCEPIYSITCQQSACIRLPDTVLP